MRVRFVVIIGVLIIGMLTACGDRNTMLPQEDLKDHNLQTESASNDSVDSEEQESETPTPPVPRDLLKAEIALSYQPVEVGELEKVKVKDSWKLTKTVDFGHINGESVSLSVYQEQDETAFCYESYLRVVLLDYMGEHYTNRDCGNTSLEESDHPEQGGSLVLLDYKSTDEAGPIIILGAVDSGANGPGLMTYYVYDVAQDCWYSFTQWGLPSVSDLDDDGTSELVFQFQGLHMHPPDVSFGRWNDSRLEITPTVTELLRLTNQYYNSATVEDGLIQVTLDAWEEFDQTESASYKFTPERLIRVDGA
ncbi:hypothetical protein H8B09_06730 [Paenibacillus sp. PR3]|uniref:Lipoprotein n=1 Tax=Paenibacillus terricola TaxID=2763503 RepID=A0ABR8MS36_9BACL|nr:hypothetical protein [Paenibacillus terricola]MBD3918445.1 hypothetical protein [Paenibacillus terricola]